MFIHAGLQVIEKDVILFYKNVLGFSENYSFYLQAEMAEQIFNKSSSVKVFNIIKNDTQLELFLSEGNHKPGFNHLCLLEPDLAFVKNKARQLGYQFISREKPDKETVFLYDSLGNMFELKNRL